MAICLDSFTAPMRVALIGASGGIGSAFAELLYGHARVGKLYNFARKAELSSHAPLYLEDESTIASAARQVSEDGTLDLVLVATGLLHDGTDLMPEKSFRSLDVGALERLYCVNAIGPALIAKHFLPLLARDRKTVFAALGARVGSIGDNRLGGWYGYRMSKAALAMLVRTLAIEMVRRNPEAVCVALHPGTVDTCLSQPFQRSVADEKLATPELAAANLLQVIDGASLRQTGHHLAWDGSRVPY